MCAAEVFERVNALTVLAVVLGLGCNDLGFTLNAGADFADFRQERIRIFAGYAQLLGLKYENAVLTPSSSLMRCSIFAAQCAQPTFCSV